jgi:hypothetical protein
MILFKEIFRINHSASSSGLNLACDGLLVGMHDEGHKEFPDEAPPPARTFVKIIIISISSLVLQEEITKKTC